jgi:hypothetical protein
MRKIVKGMGEAFGDSARAWDRSAAGPPGGRMRGLRARRASLLLATALALALTTHFASGAAAYKGFESPTQNIGCIMFEQGARCDIIHHSWPLPKKPKSCEFDYGGSVFVGDQGRGSYGCVSDSAFGAGPVLPYGESVRKDRFRCTSGEIGMRCVNLRNHHGFLLSRQRVRLF